MRRIWLVDDKIPIHELYPGPLPTKLDSTIVRHLVEQLPAAAWEEPEVLALCRDLCGPDYDATFFLSPDAMLKNLSQGAHPPHALVFDWQYVTSNDERNRASLKHLLGTSFVYVQVYTHLGGAGVEQKLTDLREQYKGRLLPTRLKAEVTPTDLAQQIRNAWAGTIAGEPADKVRTAVQAAVERALIDMCSVPSGAIAALTGGTADNLAHLVLSRVRDEIGLEEAEAFDEIVASSPTVDSSVELRHLMSVLYYFFPSDNQVRRGDLVEVDGGLGLVVTPVCDLVRFPKKTGRRLTWLRCVLLDESGHRELRSSGYEFNKIGGSIVAAHGGTRSLVILPNVPLVAGERSAVADYVLMCHAWESRLIEGAPGGRATYEHLAGLRRRCTLAEPFTEAVVARATAVMSALGTPDLPAGERLRLSRIVSPQQPGHGG